MFHYTFTAESKGERIQKIGQRLVKSWARVECPFFDLWGKKLAYRSWFLSQLHTVGAAQQGQVIITQVNHRGMHRLTTTCLRCNKFQKCVPESANG